MPPTHRLDQGPYYTVINRTIRTLQVIVDGRTFTFKPGRNPNIPGAVLPYALKQHPRLGTFDEGGEGEYLLAIEGVTPEAQSRMIAPGQEALGLEQFDRQSFPDSRGQTQFSKLSTSAGPKDRGPTFLQHERSSVVIATETVGATIRDDE